MLRVDVERWNQTAEDLRRGATEAAHLRTRERFLALYEVAQGQCPTQVARRSGRHPQTVMQWVHQYQASGPETLTFRHSGGRPPLCPPVEQALGGLIREAVQAAAQPRVASPEVPPPAPRWTLHRLVQWVKEQFHLDVCRETLRQALHRLGLSWKKAKKLLGRANERKRQEFLERLKPLLQAATWQQVTLVYIDEAHIHQDAGLGYGWAPRGQRLWVNSCSPSLAARVSFYGVYLYNAGQVEIWPFARANTEHTVEVLQRLRARCPHARLVVLWDNASYHKAAAVQQCVRQLAIELLPLPGYSPDFMPVEHLWAWVREEVTALTCHTSTAELIDHVERFRHVINANPGALADRLWVKDHLDPEEEKLRIPS